MVKVEQIHQFVEESCRAFSVSKKQQVTRLLYEISKREKNDFRSILNEANGGRNDFISLRKYLVRRRFPSLTDSENERHKFTELKLDPGLKVTITEQPALILSQFVIEESVEESALVKRLYKKYPQADFKIITKYKDHVGKEKFNAADYNQRLKTFFIVKENYDFYKKCPCSSKSVSCGYHVVNLGSGCAFECSYCYLQDYVNSPGIIIPANLEDFFTQFRNYKQDISLGAGELTDSLVFDHITDFSPSIIEFFKDYPQSIFEFKTKSNNIANLLKIKPGKNIVVSWSLNPQKVITSTEFYTASLKERLEAAVQCKNAGYGLAFHFDPIIYYQGWESDYKGVVDQLYAIVKEEEIKWISLGTLRMTSRLKKTIENRFPENTILDEDYFPGYDGKLRYSLSARTKIYQVMKDRIRMHDKKVRLYLCMEEKDACGACEVGPVKAFQ